MSDPTSSPGSGPKRRELLKRGALATGAAAAGVAGFTGTSIAGCDAVSCPRTQGYWKNHRGSWKDEALPLDIGSETLTKTEAMDLLNQPPRGNKCVIMAKQLIAALLNVTEGTQGRDEFDVSCITDTIDEAQEWMATYCDDGRQKGPWPENGEELKDRLDAFNNGRLCPEDC